MTAPVPLLDLVDDPDEPDPLHDRGSAATTWTTTNGQEALPGVATPLTWSFFFAPCETALRGAFYDIGALDRADVAVPARVDDRFIGVFAGRLAGSLDMMRRMGDQMPGSSGEAVEEQYFGQARQGIASSRRWWRLPLILGKLPVAAVRARRRLVALQAEQAQWWRRSVAPGSTTTVDEARAVLADAYARWGAVCRPHTVVSMIGQGLFEQTRRLCVSAGRPGLELELCSSGESVEEEGLVRDLWAVSRDRLPIEVFLDRWGFHGPAEGELSSRSWREDTAPLEPLLKAYAAKGEAEDPDAMQRRLTERRAEAERTLLAALSRTGRWRAQFVLGQARRFIPLREVGRGSFLMAYDVGRCMVRRLGVALVADGRLADADDAFFLTVDELLSPPAGDLAATVAFRRTRRALYETVSLPERWTGEPAVTPSAPAGPSGDGTVTGLGASPGIAEGRAVVVLDPAAAFDLEDGDILVCHTTDPSWSAFFLLVAGVVIDIGGPMSHGAILARELGIPCVINTRTGTETLITGTRIRIDGTAGTVEFVQA